MARIKQHKHMYALFMVESSCPAWAPEGRPLAARSAMRGRISDDEDYEPRRGAYGIPPLTIPSPRSRAVRPRLSESSPCR